MSENIMNEGNVKAKMFIAKSKLSESNHRFAYLINRDDNSSSSAHNRDLEKLAGDIAFFALSEDNPKQVLNGLSEKLSIYDRFKDQIPSKYYELLSPYESSSDRLERKANEQKLRMHISALKNTSALPNEDLIELMNLLRNKEAERYKLPYKEKIREIKIESLP